MEFWVQDQNLGFDLEGCFFVVVPPCCLTLDEKDSLDHGLHQRQQSCSAALSQHDLASRHDPRTLSHGHTYNSNLLYHKWHRHQPKMRDARLPTMLSQQRLKKASKHVLRDPAICPQHLSLGRPLPSRRQLDRLPRVLYRPDLEIAIIHQALRRQSGHCRL